MAIVITIPVVPGAYLRYRSVLAGLKLLIEHVTVSANEASVTVRTLS